MKAPLPPNEPERLAALARYRILDTPLEAEFDALTRLIARICEAPFAVINLIAEGRQWFKSEIGFGVRETTLDTSFCAHAILQSDLFVVPDTTLDPRFDCNPLVTGEPRLRFYAGALLKTGDGYPLGTLCVLDRRPRELDTLQKESLAVLAQQVMQMLELRRELALRVKLSGELDIALRAREQVLAVVSHDLRNPLATVVITADHLSRIANAPIERRTAERLHRAAISMRGLVDDLLDFESMDQGRLSMEFGPVSVNAVLDELHGAFDLEAADQGITLAIHSEVQGELWGDRRRLLQALGNLVGNALKATPTGGHISVECTADAAALCITVRDTGAGFDEETAARLFDPYWRGPSQTSAGAGLGLAITHRIAEAHQGTLSAASTPGEGATFTLCLPHRAPPSPAAPSP